jgi:hypothetical protein
VWSEAGARGFGVEWLGWCSVPALSARSVIMSVMLNPIVDVVFALRSVCVCGVREP